MPLMGTYFPELNPYRGDRSGGRGIGNPNDSINRVIFQTRHPEGRYIPIGRGIYGGPPLPQQTDRRDVRIPMGTGNVANRSPVTTVKSLPTVVKPRRPAEERILPTSARRIAVPSQKETKVGLDLGNLIGRGIDVWGGVQQAKYRNKQILPVAAAAAPVTQWGGTGYGTGMVAGPTLIADDSGPGFGVPGYEVISESELDKGMVYKKVCGVYKWVKQKRRRRRKLLTDADFNALLRIQALKVNTNMTIAIAKALGR